MIVAALLLGMMIQAGELELVPTPGDVDEWTVQGRVE